MNWFRVEQADALEALRRLPKDSIDLIATDPAYESLEKHRAIGTTTRLMKAWFPIVRNEKYPELLVALWRVLKPSGHMYFVLDDTTSYFVKPEAERVGFTFWNRIPWDKRRTPRDLGMGYHWRNVFEYVLFFEKPPGKQLNDTKMINYLKHARVIGGYPTEKPVGLWKDIIANSSQLGDVVLDPFCGSGSSGQAALELGRNYLGIDITEKARNDSIKRLYPLGTEVARPPRSELTLEHAR